MSAKHGGPWVEREDFGGVSVVRLKLPRAAGDDTVREAFGPVYSLTDVGRHNLVINLSATHYLSSMALGKLVMLNRKAQAAGGRLTLCQLSPTAEEVLKTSHVFHLFD